MEASGREILARFSRQRRHTWPSFSKAFATHSAASRFFSATTPTPDSSTNRALPSSWPGSTWFRIIGQRAAMASCTVAPPALVMTR